jgi:endonuclease-3
VNLVTSSLFAKYRSPRDYLQVPPEELEEDIRSTGFYRNKARSLRGICSALLDEFDGAVPETVESLVTLPGVGRKTANIVLGNAFEKNAVAVDTHVGRVARRIGLASSDDPDVIEKELQDCIPRKKWTKVSHLLVFHGRRRCKSRKPLCGTCPLFDLCRFDERGKYATV